MNLHIQGSLLNNVSSLTRLWALTYLLVTVRSGMHFPVVDSVPGSSAGHAWTWYLSACAELTAVSHANGVCWALWFSSAGYCQHHHPAWVARSIPLTTSRSRWSISPWRVYILCWHSPHLSDLALSLLCNAAPPPLPVPALCSLNALSFLNAFPLCLSSIEFPVPTVAIFLLKLGVLVLLSYFFNF